MTGFMDFLRRFQRNTSGTTLVELAIVMPLLLLLIFGVLEFGRLFWITGVTQKATAIAVRLAAVRPPVCPNVPDVISAVSVSAGGTAPRFGTVCRTGGVCADLGEQVCALNLGTATGQEIWGRVAALMPPGSTAANIRLRYSFDERIGFVGGPYSPVVTVELINLEFQFISPLGQLAALAASDATIAASLPNSISLPSMSASLPGEDLASGVTN